MLAFTIIMIFSYTIILVLSSLSKFIFDKNNKEFSKSDTDEQLIYVTVGCGIAGLMFAYAITNIIYLFNALKFDFLQYPTWIMLGLIIFNLLLSGIRSAYRKLTKTEPNTKTTTYGYFLRFVTYLYFVYMLYILIVGI